MTRQPLSAVHEYSPTDFQPLKSRRVRHRGQWLAALCVLILATSLVLALARNEKIHYEVFLRYVTAESVLRGLLVTVELTVIGMAVGVVLGVVTALARMSDNLVLRAVGGFYVWITRGTPLIVQLLLWGNLGLLFPKLGLGIPFTDIVFVEAPTNAVLSTFVASCVALSLNEGAYMAEIVRAGILGVDRGQSEAATALGMRPGLAMRRIVLPQALRIIIPPTGNQFITLLKTSALVYVIAGGDLMTAVNDIAASNYRIVELLMVATFWYLVLVTILSAFQRLLERRVSRGYAR